MNEIKFQRLQANNRRKEQWRARHSKIMAAIKENLAASNRDTSAIVGCSLATVALHRKKQIEYDVQNYWEKHPKL